MLCGNENTTAPAEGIEKKTYTYQTTVITDNNNDSTLI